MRLYDIKLWRWLLSNAGSKNWSIPRHILDCDIIQNSTKNSEQFAFLLMGKNGHLREVFQNVRPWKWNYVTNDFVFAFVSPPSMALRNLKRWAWVFRIFTNQFVFNIFEKIEQKKRLISKKNVDVKIATFYNFLENVSIRSCNSHQIDILNAFVWH